MILAFVEDGSVAVYQTVADAVRPYEGVDVESGVVRFYDDSGTFLEPRFVTPNRRGRYLGLFGWVISGQYELFPNPSANQDPIALALYETSVLEPNPWFATLDQLKTALSERGVITEWSSPDAL